ncbi:hypothetical protein F4781DRAFT_429169 [Annulohypoxylon bovei var. microspora]|nr:hypothetical protein F4781DRAFT_429169 [Annulohypoxylon bovei var. microspora]
MNSLYMIHGPFRRSLLARPSHILKRYKFSARSQLQDLVYKPKNHLLPTKPARTRFAPSPTGYLHIGSLRTALYNYLLAKATGGQFILRIEDTDQSRIVPDAEKRLYEDLKWAGLSWDEGPDVGGPFNPYKQSENTPVYSKYADQLLDEGHAYRCFCKPEELDQMRLINIQEGRQCIYNGHCSHIPPDVSSQRATDGEEHCIRFRRGPTPTVNDIVDDLVYGRSINSYPDDDFILIKKDGYPTYHFANVIDDHQMEITHVVRGAEWLISTPRHIALYRAFGWDAPKFAHVGLLVNQHGQKLSKRQNDVDISSWRDQGYLPITLLNYVLFMGWSLGKGVRGQRELMDLEEMVKKFDLSFTKGNVIVNSKFQFFQKGHVLRLLESNPKELYDTVEPSVIAHVRKYENVYTDPAVAVDSAAASIGRVVLCARAPPFSGSGSGINMSHVKKILEADIANFRDAQSYVQRIRYLIWEVPLPVYVEGYGENMAQHELHFSEQEDLATDAPPAIPTLTEDTRVSVSSLTAKLQDRLQAIEEEQWTKSAIEEALKPFLRSVFSVPKPKIELMIETEAKTEVETETETEPKTEPETEPNGEKSVATLWGSHLVRWALTGGHSGPGLILSMALLGKEATVARVGAALEAAKTIEESPDILAGFEEAEPVDSYAPQFAVRYTI